MRFCRATVFPACSKQIRQAEKICKSQKSFSYLYYFSACAKIPFDYFNRRGAAVQIPLDVQNLISEFERCGYSMFIVGGYVRDMLLGKSGGDIDLASSATPQQAEAVLKNAGIKFVETGLKHGTVTAVINHTPYEITTFRSDGVYNDSRHPESVHSSPISIRICRAVISPLTLWRIMKNRAWLICSAGSRICSRGLFVQSAIPILALKRMRSE
jgi:hypothetical protein